MIIDYLFIYFTLLIELFFFAIYFNIKLHFYSKALKKLNKWIYYQDNWEELSDKYYCEKCFWKNLNKGAFDFTFEQYFPELKDKVK